MGRGEGIMGEGVFRNNYKGDMDKTKGAGAWKQGREVGFSGVGGSSGGKMQTTVIEQQ